MIKSMINFKINILIKIFIILIFFTIKSYADDKNFIKKISIGSSEALVKIQVMSSLTCPHCADFHINVLPDIKKKYVDTGIVQIIFIDFPLDQAAFNASKLLHCVDEKKQITFLDIIYENQGKWISGSTIDAINKNLKKIVKDLGISDNDFDKCLADEAISDKILNDRIEANQKYSINSTPTIIINEKKLEGSANFKNIKKKIEKII
jgi:protein-disulfide isomerase